ncbi:MAG: nucleotidyltransferase domain-containing protein [Patescibacteria group bacterium]|jgi:predicted nucleotidyltransferase|nr:nucleotidyltransferase domain-containing protein [Patescibacteria group bacterium]
MFNKKSQIIIKVLGYFFMNPETRKHLHDLAGVLKLDVSNLSKKLKELEDEKLLSSEVDGNRKIYFLNNNFPLIEEYKKIYIFKYGFENRIKEELKKISGIDLAYIFGSFLRSDFNKNSDIDLLLVGKHSSIEIIKAMSSLEEDFGREINVVNYSKKDFLEKKGEDDFLKNIFANEYLKII